MDIILQANQTLSEKNQILSEVDLRLPVEKLLTPHSLNDVPCFPCDGKFESSFEYYQTNFKLFQASPLIPLSDQLIKYIQDEESILYKDSSQTKEQSQSNDYSNLYIYRQFQVVLKAKVSKKLNVKVQRKVSKFARMSGNDKLKIKYQQIVLFFDRKTKQVYKGTVIENIYDSIYGEKETKDTNDTKSFDDSIFEQELEIEFETDELSQMKNFSTFLLLTPREYWYSVTACQKALMHASFCGSIAFSDQTLKGIPASDIPSYSTMKQTKNDYQLAVYNEVAKLNYVNPAQKNAILHAMLTESALIQGPPGTGKSFVAFEIRKLLLKLYSPKAKKPILFITKKNSTLDEQLELDLKAGHKVIRMGKQFDTKIEQISYDQLYKHYNNSKCKQVEEDDSINNSIISTSDDEVEDVYSQIVTDKQIRENRQKRKESTESSSSSSSSSSSKIDYDSALLELRKQFNMKIKKQPKKQSFQSDNSSTKELQSPRSEVEAEATEQKIDLSAKSPQQLLNLKKQRKMGVRSNFLNSFQIIGMTFTGSHINHKFIEEVKPEIIIIEEASEVIEAELAPLLGPWVKHIIQIGDFKQLRPIIRFKQLVDEKNFGISYFERLITQVGAPSVSLTLQRRMHPKLSIFSRQFYDNQFKDDDSVLNLQPFQHFGGHASYFIHHENPEEMKQVGELTNEFEARFIVKVVNDLFVNKYKNEKNERISITILTFYNAQYELISQLLWDKIKDPINKIQVSTVDSFQGLESDIVLLSCVRSNPENSFRFLKEPNRINVAMSRARLGLLVIGNLEMLKSESKHWNYFIKKANDSKSYIKHRDNLISRFQRYGNDIPSQLLNKQNKNCAYCKEQSHLGKCKTNEFISQQMEMANSNQIQVSSRISKKSLKL